jgi:hypothetical protein
MAIIMIHHIAIVSAHVANGHGGIGAPPMSMPGISALMCSAYKCGNSESVVISQALMPSPAPVRR